MTKYKKGSMGAADQKNNMIWSICAAAVIIGVILAFFAFNTYPHEFIKRASGLANVLGFIVILIAGVILSFANQIADRFDLNNPFVVGAVGIVLLAFGLCLSCGFNFDLSGIKEIK